MDEDLRTPKSTIMLFRLRLRELDAPPPQSLRDALAGEITQHMARCTFCARREKLTKRLVFLVRTRCKRHEAPPELKTQVLVRLRTSRPDLDPS